MATIKVRIPMNKNLIELSKIYTQATQYVSDIASKERCKNKFNLHHLVYYDIRERFNLKSQFAINVIAKGFEAYKSCKKKVKFNSVPIRFDRRNSSFRSNEITLNKTKIPIEIPEYYWKYLDWRYQTMDIITDKKKRMFAHITFSREVNEIKTPITKIGVDLGVNNLAVTSDGKIFKGYKTKIIQFRYLRRKLQRKGTKSAKRLLKKSSGRQKRYMRWVNHNISKEIVSSADTIVLENLKGIRKHRNKFKGKRLNRWINSWTFYQLQSFIKYKAEVQGKRVIFVNPYMTSQTCSNCGKIGYRYIDSFVCNHCGFSHNADFNASFNLRRLNITQPNISNDEVKGHTIATEFRDNNDNKTIIPHTSVCG